MFIRKLTKALFGFCLLLCLSACSDRAEFEKRFAKVGEVYLTENVSDLFKKFPDGFHIRHMRYEYVDNKTYYHNLNMIGDPKTEQIVGEYDKSYFDNNEDITVFDKSVEYTEDKGLQFTSGEPMDPFMSDFQFAFEWFELSRKKLSSLEYKSRGENPVSGDYNLGYFIVDSAIDNQFKVSKGHKYTMAVYGHNLIEKGKYAVTISIFDIKKPKNKDYFLESIYEK